MKRLGVSDPPMLRKDLFCYDRDLGEYIFGTNQEDRNVNGGQDVQSLRGMAPMSSSTELSC